MLEIIIWRIDYIKKKLFLKLKDDNDFKNLRIELMLWLWLAFKGGLAFRENSTSAEQLITLRLPSQRLFSSEDDCVS